LSAVSAFGFRVFFSIFFAGAAFGAILKGGGCGKRITDGAH
jgi:hypothetical protein